MNLNKVTFNRKGKGRKGQTYTAFVIGKPKLSKKGKFIRLTYNTTSIREQEVRDELNKANIDVTEAMMVGHDVIKRQRAAGGSSLSEMLIQRLAADAVVIASLKKAGFTDETMPVRFRSMAASILGLVRDNQNGKTLDQLYTAYLALNL